MFYNFLNRKVKADKILQGFLEKFLLIKQYKDIFLDYQGTKTCH
ncbi:hypothetical protein CLERM_613 [Coxiella-like endosymbiont]|nr:hypothetical protein CLERM_613 [Coxiella-like endosymbiont]